MPEFDPSVLTTFNTPSVDNGNAEPKESGSSETPSAAAAIEAAVAEVVSEKEKYKAAYPELAEVFDGIEAAINAGAQDVPSYAEAVTMAAIEKLTKEPAIPALTIEEMNNRTKEQLARQIAQAQAGRLESDIPVNDPYWDVKNAYNTFVVK